MARFNGNKNNNKINATQWSDRIFGGRGHDSINAGAGNDSVSGGHGNDTVWGSAGNDTVRGGNGHDRVGGGVGNDLVTGGAGHDTLSGESGNDSLHGGAGNDWLDGGAGHDSLQGNSGNDTLKGRNGNDTLWGGTGDDRLDGGNGNDRAGGGYGNDLVTGGAGHDTLSGESGNDSLHGGTGNDLIDGGTGHDSLQGNAGDDTLRGSDGNDTLWGSEGNDRLNGGNGNDLAGGGDGDDVLAGGAGDDRLRGDSGNDQLSGGSGNDRIFGDLTSSPVIKNAGLDANQADGSWSLGAVSGWYNTGSDGKIERWGDGFLGFNTSDGSSFIELDAKRSGGIDHVQQDLNLAEGVVYTLSVDAAARSGGGVNDSFEVTHNGVVIATITPDSSTGFTRYQVTLTGSDGVDTIGFREMADQNNSVGILLDNVSIAVDEAATAAVSGQFDDTISGGDGDDLIRAQYGDDIVNGGAGADNIQGGTGADIITGGAGADILDGGAGDDDIFVGGGDVATGGTGDDVFALDQSDSASEMSVVLDGGSDATDGYPDDASNGDAGDKLDLSDAAGGVSVTLGADPEDGTVDGLDATSGDVDIQFTEIENLTLTDHDDVVDATAGIAHVNIDAGAGDDTLKVGGNVADGRYTLDGTGNVLVDGEYVLSGFEHIEIGGNKYSTTDQIGGTGDDQLNGGTGNDVLDGGEGDDSLSGGEGADSLNGGTGNDVLDGGEGDDSLSGGEGADSLDGGVGNDVLDGGEGDDSLSGGEGADSLDGGVGNDVLDGGEGDDSLSGGEGADSLDGGTGNDVLDGGEGDDSLSGGEGADSLDGGTGNDVLDGGEGDDSLSGGEGADSLDGGTGNDVLDGGEGDDSLSGGEGADSLDGGTGNDVLDGGEGDDSLSGGEGADSLDGGTGNDVLDGGEGDDSLSGGEGADSLDGGEGDDSLSGGEGSDTLTGGAGDDVLDGGAGDDDIFVGGGDVATGGTGDDVFALDQSDSASEMSVVLDGESDYTDGYPDDAANGDAGDKLDLSDAAGGVSVTLGADPEDGSVDGLDATSGDVDIQFTEIENLTLTDHDDVVDASASNANVNIDAGAGEDTLKLAGTLQDANFTLDGSGDVLVDGQHLMTNFEFIEVDGGRYSTTNSPAIIETVTTDTGVAENNSLDINLDIHDLNGDNVTIQSVTSQRGTVGFSTGAASNPAATGSSIGLLVNFDTGSDFEELAAGETTTEEITITVSDGQYTTTKTVEVTITGTNDAPTLSATTANAVEDGAAVTLDLSALGADVDGDNDGSNLEYTITGAPTEGSASISGTTLSFNPSSDFQHLAEGATEEVTIQVTATDAHGATAVNDVVVTVTGTNDAPVTNDFTLAGNSLGPVTGNSKFDSGYDNWSVDASAKDGPEGETFRSGSYSSSVTISTDQSLIPGDPNVADLSFSGYLTSSGDGPDIGTAYGPSLTSNSFHGLVGDTVEFEYRAFSGGDEASITAELVNVDTGDRTVVFFEQTPINTTTPVKQVSVPISEAGNYQIEFKIGSFDATDGGLIGARLAIGTAGINRNGILEDQTITFNASEFLAQASDVDNNAVLSLDSVTNTTDTKGTASIDASGNVHYDAAALDELAEGETYVDSFEYTVTDEHGARSTSTANITVVGLNDDPTLGAGTMSAVEDGAAVTLDLSALGDDIDSDNDGTNLTYTITGAPSEGTASISGSTLSFDPGADFQDLALGEPREVTIQVTATDAHGASAVNDVIVTVTGINDAPVSVDDSVFSTIGTSANVDVLDNDTDIEGDTINVSEATDGANGTVVVNADNTITYTPDAGFVGFDRFDYTISDGNGGSSTSSVAVTIGRADSTAVGTDIFLQGNFMELGIAGTGSLGSANASPTGYHATQSSGQISYIVDLDGWDAGASDTSVRNGDSTLPGTPTDGYVVSYTKGGIQSNFAGDERTELNELHASTIDSSSDTTLAATTTGSAASDLEFTQVISLDANATYYTTTVTLTNTSSETLTDLRYMRTFDPDQDYDTSGTYYTLNDVLSNPDADNNLAISQAMGPNSGIPVTLIAQDTDARGSNFGFKNRDAYVSQAFDSPLDRNGGRVDEAITMTFNIETLAAGESVTKQFVTSMNGSGAANDYFTGTAASESINTGDGNDVVISMEGNDQITMGLGDDTFIFAQGHGSDTLLGFSAGTGTGDRVDVSSYNFSTTAEVLGELSSDGAGDAVLDLGGGDEIIFKSISVSSLTADDFIL